MKFSDVIRQEGTKRPRREPETPRKRVQTSHSLTRLGFKCSNFARTRLLFNEVVRFVAWKLEQRWETNRRLMRMYVSRFTALVLRTPVSFHTCSILFASESSNVSLKALEVLKEALQREICVARGSWIATCLSGPSHDGLVHALRRLGDYSEASD